MDKRLITKLRVSALLHPLVFAFLFIIFDEGSEDKRFLIAFSFLEIITIGIIVCKIVLFKKSPLSKDSQKKKRISLALTVFLIGSAIFIYFEWYIFALFLIVCVIDFIINSFIWSPTGRSL